MADEFAPLMMEDLKIEVSGTKILRLGMNRHMPRVERVKVHEHKDWDQLLLYLRGAGVQVVGETVVPVRRGSLVCLKKGQPHGFRKEKNVSPVCMVIDLDFKEADWPLQSEVPGDAMQRIEQSLHRLTQLKKRDTEFACAAGVFTVISELERAVNRDFQYTSGPVFNRVKKRMNQIELKHLSPQKLADETGLNIDYLNRQLKREASTSLGKMIAEARFCVAKSRLRETAKPIGEIALEVGLFDQNYFSRWFKKQSGLTPSRWRQS